MTQEEQAQRDAFENLLLDYGAACFACGDYPGDGGADEYRSLSRYREETFNAVLAAQAQRAPEGYVLVKIEPTPGLLVSMAYRADHALMAPGYYDQPMLQAAHCVSHAQMLEATMATMRQLHEEVVGTGFYSPEKESDYAAASPQSETPK